MYQRRYYQLGRPMGIAALLAIFLVVLLVQLAAIYKLPLLTKAFDKAPLKVTIVHLPKSKDKKLDENEKDLKKRQIVEAPLKETLPPKDADYLGQTDHQTAKQTRVKNPRQSEDDPENPEKSKLSKALKELAKGDESEPSEPLKLKEPKDGPKRTIGKNALEQFLPRVDELVKNDIPSHPGYQDSLDKNLAEGDVIDVNTTEYRWIGYFTNVRKNVSLAFYSPYSSFANSEEIKRRLSAYGQAKLKGLAVVTLTIARSGILTESKLIQSSGDTMVDEFWLQVLNLAAPFPPLPKHYDKETLTFSYTLDYDYVFRTSASLDTLDATNGKNL